MTVHHLTPPRAGRVNPYTGQWDEDHPKPDHPGLLMAIGLIALAAIIAVALGAGIIWVWS